jgi:hypothetical protein
MSFVSAPPPVFTARTIDGRQVHGTLRGWDERAIALKDGEELHRLPLDQLRSMSRAEGSVVSTPDTVWVTLRDGSVIAAESYMAEARAASATTSRTGILNLPSASVDHVRFRAASPALEKRWKEILEEEIDQDLLVIANGDSLDYLGGIVRAVREQEIDFDLDGDMLPVRRSKVFAVRYYRRGGQQSHEPIAQLVDDAGSKWSLLRAAFTASDGTLVIDTPLELHVTLPLDAIARVDFAGSSLVYLSSLTADSSRWTPYFGQKAGMPSLEMLYRPRRNTALDSSPLVLDGVQYTHGLALHTRTEMTYRLTEPFERFQALAGIDDRLRPGGNVALTLLGDDRVLYDATIAGTHPAQPIDVDLKGVRTLTIIADFGADLDVSDHLILAEARLLK